MDANNLEKLILEWIGENYGKDEQNDPCYDIGSLAGHIAGNTVICAKGNLLERFGSYANDRFDEY